MPPRAPALFLAALSCGCLHGEPEAAAPREAPALPAIAAPVAPRAQEPAAALAHPPPAIEEVADASLLGACSEQRAIVVKKAARLLELRCGGALAARYEVSLGFEPTDHKEREGDGRTPEGDYFIGGKWPSQFHRSLQVAYPNAADAAAALTEGRITRLQHDAIVRAVQSCRMPPQDTGLGSHIEIHGAGGGLEVGDWTLGCVAVDNPEIDAVFAFHQPGCTTEGTPRTLLRILP